jgi:hypothetical protein
MNIDYTCYKLLIFITCTHFFLNEGHCENTTEYKLFFA